MNTASKSKSRKGTFADKPRQPLFDGAESGRKRKSLVEYLNSVRDRILPVLKESGGMKMPHPSRRGHLHAEDTYKYTPDWVRTVQAWVRVVETGRGGHAVQRATAHSCGSPTSEQ